MITLPPTPKQELYGSILATERVIHQLGQVIDDQFLNQREADQDLMDDFEDLCDELYEMKKKYDAL